jgi:hypothetical protein
VGHDRNWLTLRAHGIKIQAHDLFGEVVHVAVFSKELKRCWGENLREMLNTADQG